MNNFIVVAQRMMPGRPITRLTKAIREETMPDALVEFCNILGVSLRMLDHPEMMGTDGWDVYVHNVGQDEFLAAVQMYNLDPAPHDFRAGPTAHNDYWT